MSDAFLDVDVPQRLTANWAAMPGASWRVICGWGGARLLGFVALNLAAEGGAYVENLHVAPDQKGQGVGHGLMRRAAMVVSGAGIERLWLTVLADNHGARGFYGRIGGIEGAEKPQVMYGQAVRDLPVEWTGEGLRRLRLD
ncbi:hypothetical protein AIOL_001360 [Candidatus Rhodobacter oscarellae]|uniref:N-acetyltransferase domain-containing protein n=1 Tax=Candidatus Rhodobacter oscarellae TaxID=1675527 RepID=A0A0J9E0E0_9RHOB|nr:GNAT family N-acetyltransferase [Candidatus Rhodobacter lobularis]KMW56406.1 hypothetical protein AIOL_001360 [Candidatus Rhodobacter lobularis]